jgi:CRISPR-associated protein Csb2
VKSFSLVIEYLTGYAVATDPGTREKSEWPPHPARIFMAMAAAHFETDGPSEQKQAERDALEWLATLPPPDIYIPNHAVRDVLEVYVPVNDQNGGEALVKRSRQPRVFPRVYVGDEPVRLIWHVDPHLYSSYLDSLKSICRHVTRVGHSSSLVWMRIEDHATPPAATHTVDQLQGEYSLRIMRAKNERDKIYKVLPKLEEAYNEDAMKKYAVAWEIEKQKGKQEKQIEKILRKAFPAGRPQSTRPTFSIRSNYRRIEPLTPNLPHSIFDSNMIILREAEDAPRTFGLESTSLVLTALRNLIMSRSPGHNPPAWVSGHEANGEKLQSSGHMALIPLAFVGSQYADGHLMGAGIVFPRSISYRERASVLSRIFFDEKNSETTLSLVLGKAGVWKIIRETSSPHQQTLKAENYTRGSLSWASVTPVVLDRMPKADRLNDPMTWRQQTAEIITKSCLAIGLPAPSSVRVEKTPFFKGSLRAMSGQGGFPLLSQGRFQVHVALTFAEPVIGPVLIGAGRFRGYGMCRPWRENQ